MCINEEVRLSGYKTALKSKSCHTAKGLILSLSIADDSSYNLAEKILLLKQLGCFVTELMSWQLVFLSGLADRG